MAGHLTTEGLSAPDAAVWFSRLGQPFAPAELREVAAMIHASALGEASEVDVAQGWHEAAQILAAADRDGAWWDREEDERAFLWARAALHHTEDDLSARLAARTAALGDAIRAAAAAAAARDGIADASLVRAASDAALLASHQHALAELAGEGAGHFFAVKYALFAGGRWPLGFHRDRYVVF